MTLFDQFEDWWKHYPRKVAKGDARKAYQKALKKVSHETLVLAAKAFSASVADTDPRFICHPATWLNGERWSDETVRHRIAAAEPSNGNGDAKKRLREIQAQIIAKGMLIANLSDGYVAGLVRDGLVTTEQAKRAGYTL